MSEKISLWFLLKFGERKHMEELFNNGKIYINHTDKFKKPDKHLRYDENELCDLHYQGNKGNTVEINGKKIDFINVTISKGNPTFSHVYSMCMVTNNNDCFGKGYVFDPDYRTFGDSFVLIRDSATFFKRIEERCRELNITMQGKPVEYVDRETYHGDMGAFRKFDIYKEQKEFRVAAVPKIDTKDPLIIEIGNLSDIAVLQDMNKCPNKFIKLGDKFQIQL